MLKSKIILLTIFSVMYGSFVAGSEKKGKDIFSEQYDKIYRKDKKYETNQPSTNTQVPVYSHELNRPEGYWTTQEHLKDQKLKQQKNSIWGYRAPKNGLLCQPISEQQQREDWYKFTPYIAEFHSTVTSMPLFAVAYEAFKRQKPVAAATIFAAGVGSTVSHAIPRLWIHHVDTLTALSAIGGIVYDNNLTNPTVLLQTIQNPATLLPALSAGGMYLADVALADIPQLQKYRKKWQSCFHSSWHLIAVYALFAFVCYKI